MHRFALVTMGDIKDYFLSTKWQTNTTADGIFKAKNNYNVLVTIEPSHVMYGVTVEAEDDPSDSTHEITDKPLDVITEFLGAGIPGGDIFKQRASTDPDAFAVVLQRLASDIETTGDRGLFKAIRRLALLLNFDALKSSIANGRAYIASAAAQYFYERYAAHPTNFRMEERILDNFKNEAKQKGWKLEITDDEPPGLAMAVHGFNVKVGIDSIMYDYSFELEGYPESKEEGQVEDPIAEYPKWRNSDKFGEAAEKYNQDVEAEDEIDTKGPIDPTTERK